MSRELQFIFEWSEFLPVKPPVAFALKDVKKLDGDGLWLRYTVKDEKGWQERNEGK